MAKHPSGVKTAMNVLIVGNGFDINYKFPTQYSDFLHVVNTLLSFIIEGKPILSVSQVFNDTELQESDKTIRTLLATYKGKYDADLDANDITTAFSGAMTNEWFQYLQAKLIPGNDWVDFEREIKIVVEQFSLALDNLIEENTSGVYLHFPANKSGILLQHVCMQFPFFFMKEGVQSGFVTDKGFSYDHTSRHAIIPDYVERPFDKAPMQLNKAKVVDYLFGKLQELSHMLRDYLNWFVDMPVSNLKSAGLINDSLLQTWPWTATQVISFNYTHTLKELYGKGDTPKTHYIHGEIDNNSEIVLGVDSDENDEVQTINTTFVQFKKFFQRADYGTDLSYLNYMNYSSFSLSYDLYVIGHSLDVTDREIISETFSRAKRICIFYHSDDARKKHVRNLVHIFGKDEFESLRKKNKLRFVTQKNLSMDWKSFQSVYDNLQ